MLELNRLLRPGGYFVWSATPVYQQEAEDVEIWEGIPCVIRWHFVNYYSFFEIGGWVMGTTL